MKNFVKNRYVFVTTAVCIIIAAITLLSEGFAAYGFALPFILFLFGVLYDLVPILVPILIAAMNFIAFSAVKKDKSAGIIPTILGGEIGAFIAVHTVNRDYRAKKAVNIIFCVFLCVFVWMSLSFLLYYCGYYEFSLV